MKKIILLLIITFFVFYTQAQKKIYLSFGYERFMNDYKDFRIFNGFDGELGFEKSFTNCNIQYGLNIEMHNAKTYTLYNPMEFNNETGEAFYDESRLLVDEQKYLCLNVSIPLSLKVEIIKERLSLLAGIQIGVENLATSTEITGYDPEIGTNPPSYIEKTDYYKFKYSYPDKTIGFGTKAGCLYSINKKVNMYMTWNSTVNKYYTTNSIEIGTHLILSSKD